MSDMNTRLKELIKNQERTFNHFIVDSNNNILSGGYHSQYLARHFIDSFRLHKSDKLRVIKLEVDKNGRINGTR